MKDECIGLSSLDCSLILESLPALYLILNPKLDVVAVSRAYLNTFSLKQEEVLARSIFEIIADHPDNVATAGTATLRESLEKVLQDKVIDKMIMQKYPIHRTDTAGTGIKIRYWHHANIPILNAEKQVQYLVHHIEDVTDSVRAKQLEHDQYQVTDELRSRTGQIATELYLIKQELNDKTQELAIANQDLVTKNRAQELLRKKLENILHQQDIKSFEKQAQSLLNFVNELLEIEELDTGKVSLEYVHGDLAELVRQLAQFFKTFANKHQIDFTIEMPGMPLVS